MMMNANGDGQNDADELVTPSYDLGFISGASSLHQMCSCSKATSPSDIGVTL